MFDDAGGLLWRLMVLVSALGQFWFILQLYVQNRYLTVELLENLSRQNLL
jgi:hypothetical protein